MPYRAHFFDFDHTLFDSASSESLAFASAVTSAGIASADDTVEIEHLFTSYSTINRALWAVVEAGRIGPGDVGELRFARLVEHVGLDVEPASLAAAFTVGMQEFGELFPEAHDTVEALRERGPVALVTNAISAIQRRRLERVGIAASFDAIVISSEVGYAKPAPAIFDHTFELLGALDRATTLMVGDSLTADMAGGLEAGLATCWYNPEGRPFPSSIPVHHDIRSLDQLLTI